MMRNLYVKIFLWFWLAMVLVAATLILSIVLTQTNAANAREDDLIRRLILVMAKQCAHAYEENGKAGLIASIAALPQPPGAKAYFLREDGRDILGQVLPDAIRPIVRRATQTDDIQIEFRGRKRFVALRTVGPTGSHYVLLLDMRLPVPPFLQGPPVVQALRLSSILAVVALVCLWLARYITEPVTRLRQIASQLAKGNLAARVGSAEAKRRDELGDLSRDFDHMAAQIEALMSSQKRLITDVSHELRSPLARLSVALGLAWRHANPEIESSLERIEDEVDRLSELVGVVLKLARLESGANPTDREMIDLQELLYEIVADANFEAQGRDVVVRIVRWEPCSTIGVREALRSALENVVRNAVNYTAEGTEIEVALDRKRVPARNFAVIQVRDHGQGVPEQDLESIFKPFYRVADARDRSSGGTGLGLAITERVVRLHGGAVEARNSAPSGLIIELRLPLSGDAASVTASQALTLQMN